MSAGFGTVVDYFNLASSTLIPISSDIGYERRRVVCANASWSGGSQQYAGRYDSDVNEVLGAWRNPTVVYEVVGDMTLSLSLGAAFPCLFPNGSSAYDSRGLSMSCISASGYMITEVQVETSGVDNFPRITVSAVANEGHIRSYYNNVWTRATANATDAINQFNVRIPILARARAQDFMSCIVTNGTLQSCTVKAVCDPVVLFEDMMPCASDVVHGRYELTATIADYEGTAGIPSTNNGFTGIGKPLRCDATGYPIYTLTARKEIV